MARTPLSILSGGGGARNDDILGKRLERDRLLQEREKD